MDSRSQTIIIDSGSCLTKTGFAGDKAPRAVYPTIHGEERNKSVMVGYSSAQFYRGEEARSRRGILKLYYPVRHGIVTNWDVMEKMWHKLFYEELRVIPSESNIFLTEPCASAPEISHSSKQYTRKMEIMFETFDVKSFFTGLEAVLSLYASARTTGMMIDCGDMKTDIVPIYQGYALLNNFQQLKIGGSQLTDYLMKLLTERGYAFTTAAEREIVRDIKEKLCYIAEDWHDETHPSPNTSSDMERNYELPDGQVITVGNERFRSSEALFKPNCILKQDNKKYKYNNDDGGDGIDKLLYQSIKSINCSKNIDNSNIERNFYQNIVLSGGTSMLANFDTRLTIDITNLAPASIKPKVIKPENSKYSVFIGASILASLSLFEELFLTKKDYYEIGNDKNHKNNNQNGIDMYIKYYQNKDDIDNADNDKKKQEIDDGKNGNNGINDDNKALVLDQKEEKRDKKDTGGTKNINESNVVAIAAPLPSTINGMSAINAPVPKQASIKMAPLPGAAPLPNSIIPMGQQASGSNNVQLQLSTDDANADADTDGELEVFDVGKIGTILENERKNDLNWNGKFGYWNLNKMDDCCICTIETIKYKVKNIEKDEITKILKQQSEYLCLGFVRKHKINPNDIINVITKYFGNRCNNFVVKDKKDGNHSVFICASN